MTQSKYVFSSSIVKIINTNCALNDFCNNLVDTDFITVDTEFIREKTYWPKLCLLQIAGKKTFAAIDPLASDIDLEPVFKLFKNPRIIKVFHASRQDLEIFFNLTGHLPSPIFDTQVAAMVCGFGDSIGYEQLVLKLTGIQVDKTSRFTDWSLRPLTNKQISYALSDVIHLRPVYEKILIRLEQTNRSSWIKEEMSILTRRETYEGDPSDAYKRFKSRSSNRKFLAILRELAAWRERQAQSRNVPRNRILKDDSIIQIANSKPKDTEQLALVRGLGKKISEGDYGNQILTCIKVASLIPNDKCPKIDEKIEIPQGIGPIVDILKVLLKLKSEEFEVAGKLIAKISDIEQIAAFGEDANVPALKGWRRNIFGNDAITLRSGQSYLTIEGNKIAVRSF